MTDDRTKAIALQIVKEILIRSDLTFSYEDIGRNAAIILKAMDRELEKQD